MGRDNTYPGTGGKFYLTGEQSLYPVAGFGKWRQVVF